AVPPAGGDRARPDEAVRRGRRRLARTRGQVQRLLHRRRLALRGFQRGLRRLLPGAVAGAHLRSRAVLARTLRHRGGLHRGAVIRRAGPSARLAHDAPVRPTPLSPRPPAPHPELTGAATAMGTRTALLRWTVAAARPRWRPASPCG